MRRQGRALLRVRVGKTTVRADVLHRGEVTWAGEAGYDSLQELTDTIARLAAEAGQLCRRLVVTLERPPAQTRTLKDLPPVKERELGELVANQATRFFRKDGQPLVTAAGWAVNGKVRVAHAAAIEEPLVNAIVAGARAAGLVLEKLAPVDCPVPMMLLPSSERFARAWAERKLLRRLGIATGVVWIVVLGLTVGRLFWERRSVDQQLAALQAPLAALLSARRELRDAGATLQAVAEADRARGQALATLGAVTAALPDSAVLTSVTWSAEGAGILTGAARRAPEVLARLERAHALPAPRFEGAIAREAIGGRDWERFTIGFGRRRPP